MPGPVRYHASDALATLTLDRQEVRNALGLDTLAALERHLADAVGDPSVKLVLLDAEGPAFCAGMDLKSVDLADPAEAASFSAGLAAVYRRLMTLPLPLLCAVDGPVSGGGVGLVAAADLVWAGPGARFQLPETRLGIVPALVSVPLARRVGDRVVTRMALGGGPLDAEAAAALGVADFQVASSASGAARAFARELLREHAHGALVRTKRFLLGDEDERLDHALARAAREFQQAVDTEEARRGLEAFRRKEAVRWNTE